MKFRMHALPRPTVGGASLPRLCRGGVNQFPDIRLPLFSTSHKKYVICYVINYEDFLLWVYSDTEDATACPIVLVTPNLFLGYFIILR